MRRIKVLADEIKDEIEGAKNYAECYVEYKVKGSTNWSNRFKEMANDELKHATYLHELVVKEIEDISKTITPPQEMMDKWDECHKYFVDKAAWIKQMLAM